jgi:hypothetical protein
MRYRIFVEDLAACAFIELLAIDDRYRSIGFQTLARYGESVRQALAKRGIDSEVVTSASHTLEFVRSCSDVFEFSGLDGNDGYLSLRPDKTRSDLVSGFCGSVPIPVLEACGDAEAVSVLLGKQ